jgi:hypothetical protein
VPSGCIDYKVCAETKKLVESDGEETWRCAGHAKLGFGFELTQDAEDQEGHLLCRHPFEAKSDEIHCTFVYTMKPKNFEEKGGQGLCAYLCDPSVPGWDRCQHTHPVVSWHDLVVIECLLPLCSLPLQCLTALMLLCSMLLLINCCCRHFDGSGPLGFVGKKGAILGVGIDCTGTFCEGAPSSVAVKRAADNKLLCEPVVLEGGVATKEEFYYWRKVHIKFDFEKMEVDVIIDGQKILQGI